MRLTLLACCFVAALSACPSSSNPDGSTGGGRGGGSGGGGGALSQFALMDLDPNAGVGPKVDGGVDAGYQGETPYFAIAVDPVAEKVGVAYYTPAGTFTVGPGTPDYNLNYLEYNHQTGAVTAPTTIRFVQRKIGLSLQFNPATGEPIVAFLGGASTFVMGQSISWFQNDAVFRQRAGGIWPTTDTTVARNSGDVVCGNAPSDIGFLVGVWPSIVFDAQGRLVYGYRDCHDGQFPQQDWGASDVEIWDGTETSLTGHCVNPGGNNKGAWGGHVTLVEGASQPAVIYDRMLGTADTNGSDVIFQQRRADLTWTAPLTLLNIANTQTGASIAFDHDATADGGTTEGFGIAVVDRATNVLHYTNSVDGVHWSADDQVFGAGSGGWYPSLAMDPMFHEPAIAFYVCSDRSGINDSACSTTEDELFVAQRISGNWQTVSVDKNGGYAPKLGFFASGKRVIVYRVPPAIDPNTGVAVKNVGALKIAVER